jgi:hypothetical protein
MGNGKVLTYDIDEVMDNIFGRRGDLDLFCKAQHDDLGMDRPSRLDAKWRG